MPRSNLLSNVLKLRHLPNDERALFMQALVLLPLTFLGVHVLGVGRWQGILAGLTPFSKTRNSQSHASQRHSRESSVALADRPATLHRARVIARIVRTAAEHGICRPNCLQQSLVLWWLLGRHQIEGVIRFGARREHGDFTAHAWVECFGVALNERSDVCLYYSPFAGVAAGVPTEMR